MMRILWILLLDVGFSDIFCNTQTECVGQNLTSISGSVWCNGFDSCRDGATIMTGEHFWALGAYCAYNSTNITSRDHSYCHGESSCRQIDHFNTFRYTYCRGYKSCFGTRMTSRGYVFLGGYKSAAYSTLDLYHNTTVLVMGALSLSHATINIYHSSTIYAYQDFSLIGTNFYCDSGQTCTVECYNYGCANISSATGNGTYDLVCTYNLVPNIFCNTSNDIGYALTIDIDNDLPSTLIAALIGLNVDDDNVNSDDDVYFLYKNLSNPNVLGINCGDYNQCSGAMLNYSQQSICCTSYLGCSYASGLITVNTTLANNKRNFNISNLIGIYCGGGAGCFGSITHGGQFIIDRSIASANNSDNLDLVMFDIHCNGYMSCQRVGLDGADNLYCRGARSCTLSQISSMTTIFGTGASSLSTTDILDTSGDIYCIANYACVFSIINQTGGNTYGFGSGSLYSSIITNCGDTPSISSIYAIGDHAGYYITVHNVESMFASGYQVLYNSSISGIRNLYVNGTDALSASLIISKLSINDSDSSTDPRVALHIAGTNYGSYTILCSFNDECFIYCESHTSCANMILICDGICFLDCTCSNYTTNTTYNCIQCPQNISGTWYEIKTTQNKMTTVNPTLIFQNTTTTTTTTTASTTTATITPAGFPTLNVTALDDERLSTRSNNNDENNTVFGFDLDNNVLVMMVIIFCFTLCMLLLIVIMCIVSFCKKKLDVKEKEIELDLMAIKLQQMKLAKSKETNIVPDRKAISLQPNKAILNNNPRDIHRNEIVNVDNNDKRVEGEGNGGESDSEELYDIRYKTDVEQSSNNATNHENNSGS